MKRSVLLIVTAENARLLRANSWVGVARRKLKLGRQTSVVKDPVGFFPFM